MESKRGVTRLDTWLSRLLIALVRKNGGELRISGYDLEDVPDRCILFTDYDGTTHEVVIRAGTGAAEAIVIHTGEQWAKPSSPEANSPPSPQPPSRSAVPTDADVAAMEQRLFMRAAERKRQREQDELNSAQRR